MDHFIRKGNREMGRRVQAIDEKAMAQLMNYAWPGNVRELENLIKRAMVISREDVLAEHLFEIGDTGSRLKKPGHREALAEAARRYFLMECDREDSSSTLFQEANAILEKALIGEALDKTGQNQQQAARLLGMNRSTLRKKIREYQA